MGSHRADHRGSRRRSSGSTGALSAVPTGAHSSVPTGAHSAPSTAGKRRAARHAGARGALIPILPSPPVLAGVAVLALSIGGALASTSPEGDLDAVVAASGGAAHSQPGALSGVSGVAAANLVSGRATVVSRAGSREVAREGTDSDLVAAAESAAEERNQALAALGKQAQKQAARIEANLWVAPLSSYRLSAGFGETSYLWSSIHTGIDLSTPSGTPIMSVARGVVTEVGYDGSYGNKTVVTLEDGTEIWYCHQTSFAVSVGDSVGAGEVIGYVGSTGNSTGPHLHLEVRPGAGDPVDPYAALAAHGVTL